MDKSLVHKVEQGLERVSEVFKVLLWQQAKLHKVSPIQISLLLFVKEHDAKLCSVSNLANEFNITRATVSDAVSSLHKKGFLERIPDPVDNRQHSLSITAEGSRLIKEIGSYKEPLSNALGKVHAEKLTEVYSTLTDIIHQLNNAEILKVQRMCYSCEFFTNDEDGTYCNLLKSPLKPSDIRLDCPEHELKNQ